MNRSVSAVDLFCGVGGLTHGLIREGIPVHAGIDIDPKCRYPYEYNNKARFFKEDVAKLSGYEVATFYPVGDIKVLVGCAPCQPFSTYTQGRKNTRDKKWGLLGPFSRIIKEVRPEIVSMENVPQLEKQDIFKRFVRRLRRLGYFVTHHPVDCRFYGVPQTRRRLVLFASRFGAVEIIPPTHQLRRERNVRKVIAGLPPLKAGEIDEGDPLHRASALSPTNLRRIRASKPGGTWRDWSADLVAECHKTDSGRTYPSVYGRMAWDKSGPTITTQCHGFGNGRFGHPEQDRAISLREAALLQTFPKKYRFVSPEDPVTFNHLGKLIGNAVPVRLGCIIGRTIRKHVEAHRVQ